MPDLSCGPAACGVGAWHVLSLLAISPLFICGMRFLPRNAGPRAV